MRPTVVVDTGPIVALLDADEARHGWARARFEELRAPLLTCEAVLAEASFLVRRAGADPSLPARLVRRGVLEVAGLFDESDDDTDALIRLMRRYADVPMSFADACLVRIVERTPNGSVMTIDSGFRSYRQARRRTIPLLIP